MILTQDAEYELLEARLKTLLPEEYQDSYDEVQPVSMGSAGLKFGPDGRVAWDEIWGSFCNLAMAGGPPHRGTLLEPATKAEIELERGRYKQVVDELCRGVEMVTGLAAERSRHPGWIHVDCPSTGMAGWLVRAITMENISAHVDGMALYVPAGPGFRLEKEIKNVVTSIAKTCHYWVGHTSVAQHRAIGELFKVMESEQPLVQTAWRGWGAKASRFEDVRVEMAAEIQKRTGLETAGRAYFGWLGVDCLGVRPATWMMRMMVASNVLCRREENLVYVPVDAGAGGVGELVARAYRLAQGRGVIGRS